MHGLCVACRKGYYNNVTGGSCTACPAPLSSSPLGSRAESQCTCPSTTLEIAETDMAVVQSLGTWSAPETLIGIDSLLHTQNTGGWSLRINGFPHAVTVTVGSRLVFQCRHTCQPTTLELRGMRGLLNATGAQFSLLVHTRRQVILRSQPEWWPAAQDKAQQWAAQGLLTPGFAIFRNRHLSRTSQCSPCPANLLCTEW